MMTRRLRRLTMCSAAVGAFCLAGAAPRAAARIDPSFTPVHLVDQSQRIVSLELTVAKGGIAAKVVKCLKGTPAGGAVALDLSKAGEAQAAVLRRAAAGKLAVMFVGAFRREGDQGDGGPEPAAGEADSALLHVGGKWFELFRKPKGRTWLLDRLDERMQATWAGGTDMLLRAVGYILASPDPTVPVRTGASWAEKIKIAELSGKCRGVEAVDLDATGKPVALHLLCDAGDRLLRWDAEGESFADLTAGLKLTARSRAAAWADLNADGRLDVASWDGKSLRLWLATAAGTFEAGPALARPAGGCTGLSAVDVGAAGRAGIVIGTAGVPMLVRLAADGTLAQAPVAAAPAGKSIAAGLGAAGRCLTADLDGDGLCDLLQPFAKGALFYKGVGPGRFAPPTRLTDLGTGKGGGGAFPGDFDADGLLDVFIPAGERCFLWQNLTGGRFADAMELTGEAAYISKPNGIGGAACDVNNDGRQDVLVLYADRPPQLFFNRGFRSFGHSHELDLAERQLLPAAAAGQQAGLAADLDGDGAQDMVLVLNDGAVWVFFRETADVPALSARAVLPAAGGLAGPLTVVGFTADRNLGAWNVRAGGRGAFFGLLEAGSCTVRWRLPGRDPAEKKLAVKDRPVRFALPAGRTRK